jgi:osmoprotectant transport system permease protein
MAEGEPLIDWGWIVDHLDVAAERLAEHLQMTGVAVLVGLAISFLLALLIVRTRIVLGPITVIAGILYTIPSLAVFALLVPFTGLSFLTAEIALVSYTILILVRSIVAGLDAVQPEVVEAAEGMGYSRWQRLWRVELPLAVPLIITGLRLATVTTIGLVTVTALIGQGGLGQFIREGKERFFATELYLGAALSILLAVAADALFVLLQRLSTPWARRRTG